MKRLTLTADIHLALELVARSERYYRVGLDSYSILELPKLALADAVLTAVRAQQTRLTTLPRPTPAVVRPSAEKRRRRA